MNTEQRTPDRRVLARYSAEDRERLTEEHAQSGLTKKEFCRQRRINLGTFYSWTKKRYKSSKLAVASGFAEVNVQLPESAVEVLLPNGSRIGIRHMSDRDKLVALVRGVAGC